MEQSTIAIKDTTANPAPLGLLAFGTTTILLNLHNAGIFEMNSMILAMGIFYGGLAQVIAGIMEAKKNNTFGLTAFTSYGFFWLTLVGINSYAKTWLDTGCFRKRHDSLSYYMGTIYRLPFFWHTSHKQGIAICICHINHFIFFTGRWETQQAMHL